MQMIAFDPNTGLELAREDRQPWPPNQAVQDDFAHRSGGVVYLDSEGEFRHQRVKASIVDGQVVSVVIDPDYTPPEPEPDPVQERLAALEATVKANVLASDHDKRWLRVKEFAKDVGVPWLKAHPTATEQELVDAVLAAAGADAALGADETVSIAGEHLARWLLATYAVEAKRRGYIPVASFEALRDLVVAASDKQIKQMLAAL